MLFDRVLEGGFAEICLSKRAPHLHFGDVFDVIRDDDRLVHLVALGHEPIQEVGRSIRVHDLPMWIGCLRRDEVIGKSEGALAVLRGVRDEALVGFRALKRSALVAVLGKAARRSNDQCG